MEKLLWASWELKTDVVPNAVHKGKLSFRILEDYEHLLADRYLNSWRCTKSCVLGVLFLPSSLIFRYILVIRGDDMISTRINIVIKKIRKVTFWRRGGRICQNICLRCWCQWWRLAWRILLLTSWSFGARKLAFPPSGNICERWCTIADVRLVSRQSIIDRLTTSADS